MAANFPSSFEESNPTKKQVIERWLLENVDDCQQKNHPVISFRNSTSFFFTSFRDFQKWQPSFKSRVLLAVMDHDMKEDLMTCGLINWCPNVRTLAPVNVPKDDNSLLHAVGTAVWGITDRSQLLRRVLCLALGMDSEQRFQGRWLHHRQRQISQFVDRLLESGSQVMDQEWTEIRQCLEPDRPQSVAAPHRVLEAIHVYTLANILRRPIIVLTNPAVRGPSSLSLQDVDDMGGIYLPLEWSWLDTCRSPVLLAFSHGRFCPLLFTDHPNPSGTGMEAKWDLTPLVNSRFEQLPVRFLLQGEEPQVAYLLSKYLRVRETVMQVRETVQNVLCAQVEATPLPPELNLVTDFISHCMQRSMEQQQEGNIARPSPASYGQALNPAAGPLERRVAEQEQEQRQGHGQASAFTSASNQPPAIFPGCLSRERVQGAPLPQYGLGDPTLHSTAAAGGGMAHRHHEIHIPPPALLPLPFRSTSAADQLSPTPEQACKTVGCSFFGDPALGMLCSTCFRNYTIQESRQGMGVATGARSRPSAPLPSMPAEEPTHLQISMMREKCQLKCGYYCSTKTYPYCHECAGKIQKQAQKEAMAAAFNESAFAPNDRERSLAAQSNSGKGAGAVPPTHPPQESKEMAGNITAAQVATNIACSETAGAVASHSVSAPHAPQDGSSSASQPPARGGVPPGEEEVGEKKKAPYPPTTHHSLQEAMTQALVTGDPPGPLLLPPGAEDPSPLMLFGSGQQEEEEPVSSQPRHIRAESATAAPSPLAVCTPTQGAAAAIAAEEEGEVGRGGPKSEQSQTSGMEIQHQQQQQQQQQPPSSSSSSLSGQDLTSAAHMAKSRMTPPSLPTSAVLMASPGQVAHTACARQGCMAPPVLGTLCGRCYIGQSVKTVEPTGNMEPVGLTNLKITEPVSVMEPKMQMPMLSMHSTHSSAPASVGPASVSGPRSGATYTKAAGGEGEEEALGQPESRSQPSSLRDLRNIPPMNYTHSWIQDNRFAEESCQPHHPLFLQNALSGPKSAPPPLPPPQGLPEKPESVGLGNDLIASGMECFSSTQRCIGEGCGNAVPQAGRLCQQCRDILRQARQGRQQQQQQGPSAAVPSSPAQGEQSPAERQLCQTGGCTYYGIPENLGYCTHCYRRHVEREVEERNRHHISRRTITVPPEFHHVHMPANQQGQLCTSAGCRLFGDPEHGGMCFKHYQQHLVSISKATWGTASTATISTTTTTAATTTTMRPNITITYGPGMYVTPSSMTYIHQPGNAFPASSPQVSVPPPPLPSQSARAREPSLGETYYRVAGRHTNTCLNPLCSNFGNSSKGGLCNRCAEDRKINDDLISRAIYGDEEMG